MGFIPLYLAEGKGRTPEPGRHVATSEKTLKEIGDKVSSDQKARVEKAIENTRDEEQ